MFLRWHRKKTVSRGADFYYIRPELVESFRDEGKPRQRTIKYLGSIREMWARAIERESILAGHYFFSDYEEKARTKFWQTVDRKLHDLEAEREDFTQEDVDEVKAQIGKRVDRVLWYIAQTPEGGKEFYL